MHSVGLQFGKIYKTDLTPGAFCEKDTYEPGGKAYLALFLAELADQAAGQPVGKVQPFIFYEEEGDNCLVNRADDTFHIRTQETRDEQDDLMEDCPGGSRSQGGKEAVIGDVYVLTGKDAKIAWWLYRRYMPEEAVLNPGARATTFLNWIGSAYLALSRKEGLKIAPLWVTGTPEPDILPAKPAPPKTTVSQGWTWPKWPSARKLVRLVIEGCFPSSGGHSSAGGA